MEIDELPGLLRLQIALEREEWPQTMDAEVWAEKWLQTLKEHPEIALDKGCMIGWFANAIMAGFDTCASRKERK